MGYSPWGQKESDTSEWLSMHPHNYIWENSSMWQAKSSTFRFKMDLSSDSDSSTGYMNNH